MNKYLFIVVVLLNVYRLQAELVEINSDVTKSAVDASSHDKNDESVSSLVDDMAVDKFNNDNEQTEKSENIVEINVEDDNVKKLDYEDHKTSSYIEIDSAIIQFLNQDSGVHEHKKLQVGQEYRFERLKVTLKKCFMSAPGEPLCVWAYLVIEELDNSVDYKNSKSKYKEIFSGWMSSSKPSANTLENRTYDVRVESDADE